MVATKAAIAWADGGNADLFPVDNGTVSLVSLAIAVLLTIASVHAGYCALRGDSRDAWIRLNAVAFATTGGTRFYGADLTNADFTGTQLRGADFRRAILTEVDWRNASGIDWAR
ncbi:MAG: pentapeptide repeat-containing protein [Elainellaceae cyanobacterium]